MFVDAMQFALCSPKGLGSIFVLMHRNPTLIVRICIAIALLIVGSRVHAGGGSLCCPSDVDGDASVGATDLAIVLGAWGPTRGGIAADIDGSGAVDATDLALLLGNWGNCSTPCLKTLVTGHVALADGTPVSDAVLITDLGGKGVSGLDGSFSFEVDLTEETTSLTLTAVASLRGTTFSGTKRISSVVFDGVTEGGLVTVIAGAPCDPSWLPTFGGAPGTDGTVLALAVFDDGLGGGPGLYAGGGFTLAGGVPANRIAKWDGSRWSALAGGLSGTVQALVVHDDGSGPALFAGGFFTNADGNPVNRIAKWDGVTWSPLGDGLSSVAYALAVYDDGLGEGPALYAGGAFTAAGGVAANRIARWNGSSWSAVGSVPENGGGVSGDVWALTAFDDGSGSALYVGGTFGTAGGVSASRIAKWNGASWSALGLGVNSTVRALASFNDGSGDALYAGGVFTAAGGIPASRVARWDGAAWSPLASGVNGQVNALVSFDDGSGAGPQLIAGGDFTTAGGVAASRLAAWTGSAWSSFATGATSAVAALVAADQWEGAERKLFVGGSFAAVGDLYAYRVAGWNGSSWSTLGSGLNQPVFALTVFDDGGGSALFAAGQFEAAGSAIARNIAKWNGVAWVPLGTGLGASPSDKVYALTVFDDGAGDGPALYAGGEFTTAGGAPANRIAKWDGSTWSPVGSGLNGAVHALLVLDDRRGGSARLVAGGAFTTAGSSDAFRIAAWDGQSWSSLGLGLGGAVQSLAAFDDGTGGGTALYAAGTFASAGFTPANNIAKWDGTAWSALGAGVNLSAYSMAVFDDGSGSAPALYVGGNFSAAGGSPASRVAKWDGTAWSPLGSGMNKPVTALFVFDDGSDTGALLYAGGDFTSAGGVVVDRIARWNGVRWSGLDGAFFNGEVNAFTTWDAGSGPALIVGGGFSLSASGDSFLSAYGCPDR